VQKLRSQFGEQRVWGKACDVRDPKSIQALADYAKSSLGYVDIWINNAGTNSYQNKSLMDSDDADIMEIVETNTLGVMLCCRQAIKLMKDQRRGGHIFNMDGAGADGNATPRYAAYGATKRSLAQFTKSLQAELKQSNIQNVVVHNLSPGMVTTDLLMSGSDTRQAKFFINVLAEPAETVAEYLVPRVRKIVGENKNNSTYTRYLTGFKAYTQILARLLFKARKDRFVPED
jgi:chlorophyll(ide) b reductase